MYENEVASVVSQQTIAPLYTESTMGLKRPGMLARYWALVMGVVTPLVCVLSVEANVIISSRVNDMRAAQQLGAFVILPIVLVMVLVSTLQTFPLVTLALILPGGSALADIAMFYLSKATFQREEILTKWK